MDVEPISSFYFFVMLLACSVAILLYRYTITIRRFLKSFIKISKKVSDKEFQPEENLVNLLEILIL